MLRKSRSSAASATASIAASNKASWIDADFGDDDDGFSLAEADRTASTAATSRGVKRGRPSSRPPFQQSRSVDAPSPTLPVDGVTSTAPAGHSNARRPLSEDTALWLERHRPLTASQLCVHPKKVEEVRAWISREVGRPEGAGAGLSRSKHPGLLVLTGPPGSGKTATLRALANDLQCHIQEWANPDELVQFEKRGDDDFVGPRAPPGDSVPYVSQATQFKNFMLRANRYQVLSGLKGESESHKLVLLEDLPPFAHRRPDDFHAILRQYLSCPRSRSSPLVVVVSATDKDDKTMRTLFPADVLARLRADVVAFNPVAPTQLVKALAGVARSEAVSGVRRFGVPDKSTLNALAESSGGDVRGAINALQFACLKGSDNLQNCFTGDSISTNSSSKKSAASKRSAKRPSKSKSKSSDEPAALAAIGGRDSNLDLFHAIGKVLYAKREDEPEPEVEGNLLPVHLRRKQLKSVPEEIVDKAPMSEDAFTAFLHQSYPGFFTQVSDLADAAEYLSCADGFFNEWTSTGKISLSEYGGLLAVRGLCFSNTKVAKIPGMRTFHKPDWYQTQRTARERSEQLSRAFCLRSLTKVEVSTLMAPFFLQISPQSLPAHLHEMARFAGVPAPARPHNRSQVPALAPVNGLQTVLEPDIPVEEEMDDYLIEDFD